MDSFKKQLALSGVLLMSLPLLGMPSVYAAKAVHLNHQNLSVISSLVAGSASGTEMREVSRNISNHMTHIRVQQTYAGYKVWGADAVVHIPSNGKSLQGRNLQSLLVTANKDVSMNGTIYQDIAKDLANSRVTMLSANAAEKAMASAIETYAHKIGGMTNISDKKTTQIVFIDKDHKAHWAYLVSFDADAMKAGELPAKPNYIIDAETLKVYAEWNDIKTLGNGKNGSTNEVPGGGFGGNKKMGKLVYDGTEGNLHYAKLLFSRDDSAKNCLLQNSDVVVKNYRSNKVMAFKCETADKDHSDLYWDGEQDAVNGGYSPSNDALFGGNVIKGMYRDWYDVPVLTDSNGKPMLLTMVVHDPIDNAYWDGNKMTFGDGVNMFYPLTSLGVAAHEISHGFTEQHSGLAYYDESGGMNEAFSDMAAQAAEFYAYGKNSWQIGPEIFKAKNEALRYMDKPSTDCGGREPGNWCSIDSADQYYSGLDVHYSSGVFNRAFYLMGTAEGWDPKKAFDVMVHANENYWTSTSSFSDGACGVLSAAKELGLEQDAIKTAFATVNVDTSTC